MVLNRKCHRSHRMQRFTSVIPQTASVAAKSMVLLVSGRRDFPSHATLEAMMSATRRMSSHHGRFFEVAKGIG